MKVPAVAIVDFETKAIAPRPNYPPEPVGVSITMPGKRSKAEYSSWGHPIENNCTKAQGKAKLRHVWDDPKLAVLGHHWKFDSDVAETRLGLKPLPWERCHDTLYLLFLYDPHQRKLNLKPAAERLLGMPPEEQDAVRHWVLKHVPGATASNWGAYIGSAPGNLVGRYAEGDCKRTGGLFEFLYQNIVDRGMLGAYNRERQLMPLMLANERAGVRVNLRALERDIEVYQAALIKADNWLRKRVGKLGFDENGEPLLNIDADQQWGNALHDAGIVTEWKYTAKSGKRSVSKINLTLDMYNNPHVASVYGYRNRLSTALRTFLIPWLEVAQQTGGTVHTSWNQVRAAHGEKSTDGTKTGRFSSTNPNFQNIPKGFEDRGDGYKHPTFLKVPSLPLARTYMLPDKGEIWLHRDYSQQELRLLAHFAGGTLLQDYLKNPGYSIHKTMQAGLEHLLGRSFYYPNVKAFDFQVLYGGGIPAAANALKCDAQTAKQAMAAIRQILPGYDALNQLLKETMREGGCVVTWGGREYYCEPPVYSEKFKRQMTFEYKALNMLIQGSAADCTKEAIIRLHAHPKFNGRMLTTVHDEINISCHPKELKEQNKILTEVMQSIELDLPLISEGKAGPNWGTLPRKM